MSKATPENLVTRQVLLATTSEVDWMRNNIGSVDENPECSCPQCGCRFRRHHGGSRWVQYGVGGPGGTDYVGIIRKTGLWIGCEMKSLKGKLRPEQEQFIARVRRSGGIACVARRPEDVIEAIHNERAA